RFRLPSQGNAPYGSGAPPPGFNLSPRHLPSLKKRIAMRIFAADRLTLDLFAAAIAGDRTAREIVIGYVLPTRLPPSARKRLRDSRILTLAASVSAQSPGITP